MGAVCVKSYHQEQRSFDKNNNGMWRKHCWLLEAPILIGECGFKSKFVTDIKAHMYLPPVSIDEKASDNCFKHEASATQAPKFTNTKLKRNPKKNNPG